uniref:Uncharacterized protein n=1 Tax=Oncorhynchus tshawytscha TaxID=74940 RepID=A0A8C8GDP7_ONCTS
MPSLCLLKCCQGQRETRYKRVTGNQLGIEMTQNCVIISFCIKKKRRCILNNLFNFMCYSTGNTTLSAEGHEGGNQGEVDGMARQHSRPRRWQSITSPIYMFGKYLKRIRFHGRGMFAIMDKVHCHYFVKLVEGLPSKVEQKTGYFNRTIIHTR